MNSGLENNLEIRKDIISENGINMDHLKHLGVFIAIADTGSLVGAARALNLSPPTVTRILSDLEAGLGVPLFHRTTRAVVLTDTGQSFLDDARRIVADYDNAIDNARGARIAPTGTLRVTASMLFGQHYVLPIIQKYLDLYPDVTVEATFVDRVVNIVDEGFDIAVRIGQLNDSSLLASRVGSVRHVVCGCPEYFAWNGLPSKPEDLKKHDIISAGVLSPTNDWMFAGGEVVRVTPRLRVNSIASAIAAARTSWGITRVLSYQIGEELDGGGLKTVLEEYEPEALPIHIIHPEGRAASAKIRTFMSMATEILRANPYLNR